MEDSLQRELPQHNIFRIKEEDYFVYAARARKFA